MTNQQTLPEKTDHYKWFNRVTGNYFFIAGSLLSIVVLFFIVNTESGRALAGNPMLREFILSTFPDAQLWVNTTLKYKQEIVLVYLYYVLLLLWAGGILVYLFIFNWKRMIEVQKRWFVSLQVGMQLCTFKTIVKLVLLQIPVMIGIIFFFGFLIFEPSLTPLAYDDYHHNSSARGLGRYDAWNSYIAMSFMFIAKVHLIFPLILWTLLQIISILMCFKKNAFYSPKK